MSLAWCLSTIPRCKMGPEPRVARGGGGDVTRGELRRKVFPATSARSASAALGGDLSLKVCRNWWDQVPDFTVDVDAP